MYEVLGERRRRYVLYHLRETDDGVSNLASVVEDVCTLESDRSDVPGEEVDDLERAVATTLHHVHLPKLVERGVLDYDWRTETIRYYGDELLERHLDVAEEHERG